MKRVIARPFVRGMLAGMILLAGVGVLYADGPWLEVCTPFVNAQNQCDCKDSCKHSNGESKMCNRADNSSGGSPGANNCECTCHDFVPDP
jgi:hypothetical protein